MIGLFALFVRRALRPSYVAIVLGVLAFAASRDWGVSAEVLAALPEDASRHAAARQGVWLLGLLLVLALMTGCAAATVPRWREDESAWLGTRPTTAAERYAAALAGPVFAGLGLLAAVAVAAEFAVGAADQGARIVATPEHDALACLGDERRIEVALGSLALERGDEVALTLYEIQHHDIGVDVRLSLDSDGEELGAVNALVVGREVVGVAVERAPRGATTLVLERLDPSPGGGCAARSSSALHLRRDTSERRAGIALFARGVQLLAAGCALALGLGAWLRASLAGLVAFALWAFAAAFQLGSDLLPGADLGRAFAWVGDGIAPPLPAADAWVGTLALVLVGLGLGLAKPGGGLR